MSICSLNRRPSQRAQRLSSPRAFTLLEIMVVVVVLGIAGALVIPAMGETGILKVQAAVRMVISDLTFIQCDAVAFQERRAMVVDVENSSYALLQVPGSTLDVETNTLFDPTKADGRYLVNFNNDSFGGARIISADFGGNDYILFDALGGPIAEPDANTPSSGGTIRIRGSNQTFIISVESFTGRVTVARDTSGG